MTEIKAVTASNDSPAVVTEKKKYRKAWVPEEDAKLIELVEIYGTVRKWPQISSKMLPTVRTGKQCWERYHNHLKPELAKKQQWTKEEYQSIYFYRKTLGKKWAQIAKLIPGRSDNDIKNRWNYLKRNAQLLDFEPSDCLATAREPEKDSLFHSLANVIKMQAEILKLDEDDNLICDTSTASSLLSLSSMQTPKTAEQAHNAATTDMVGAGAAATTAAVAAAEPLVGVSISTSSCPSFPCSTSSSSTSSNNSSSSSVTLSSQIPLEFQSTLKCNLSARDLVPPVNPSSCNTNSLSTKLGTENSHSTMILPMKKRKFQDN